MSSRCWVIGSAVLDTVYSVDRLPQPGENVIASKVEQFLGGKGVNQAIACSRSDAETSILLCLGLNDNIGDKFVELLETENLSAPGVIFTDAVATGQASVTIAPNGMNTIAIFPGSNMHLPASLITQSPIKEDDYVLCQFEVPNDVIIAASQRGKFILNPAPFRPFPEEILKNCFAITPNETEAKTLTGISPTSDKACQMCCNQLIERGVTHVILTLGENGVFYQGPKACQRFPAPKVDAVDTTAAGDVFNGALIARLSLGDTFEQAIPYSVAAASLSVTKAGAVPSIPRKQKIENFMSARNS